ncbi:MAG: N-acetyltransferase family protein [bacterium]
MDSEITIRLAGPTDWQGIIAIYNQGIEDGFCTAITERLTVETFKPWLEIHDGSNFPIFIAEKGDKMLGWCSLSPYRPGRQALRKTGEISYYMDRTVRGQGVGKRLIKQTLEQAAKYGLYNLIAVLLDVNTVSVRLLERFGFKRWGHFPRTVDFGDTICGQFIYGKNLADPTES